MQVQIAREVKRVFGPPNPYPQRRITVVLYPICVSTVDSRFAFVVVDPVQRSGDVAQPGYLYLRRTPSGYHALDPLLTASTSLRRPSAVPRAVYDDWGIGTKTSACSFQGSTAVQRVLAGHLAPFFVW
jgi:hypothetical protein